MPAEIRGDDWRRWNIDPARRQPRWSRERGLRHPDRGVCGWCGKSLSGKLARRWCSSKCNDAAYRAMGTFVRRDGFEADRKAHHGRLRCAACGRREKVRRLSYGWTKSDESEFDVDHVRPIGLGGDPIDPANLQVLCRPCHKAKTARDAALVAAARRRLKYDSAMRQQARLPITIRRVPREAFGYLKRRGLDVPDAHIKEVEDETRELEADH